MFTITIIVNIIISNYDYKNKLFYRSNNNNHHDHYNNDVRYEHFLAWNVTFNTNLFDRIETYISNIIFIKIYSFLGQRNFIYLFSVLALWRATGTYPNYTSINIYRQIYIHPTNLTDILTYTA